MQDSKILLQKTLVLLGLSAAILLVFWQAQTFKLVRYDDPFYVAENSHVLSGITKENVLWAFTNAEAGFWHPLTWLSLMLDFELHGFRPGGYHWTNVMFHLASALLLFLVLDRMTGAVWRSAFVAALFALHPLQVEPVAWVSQRKDMLSTFFAMLTLLVYCRYAEKPSLARYLYVVFFFVLGLMSKPMIVTLPFVMLLLDYWPLRRFPAGQAVVSGSSANFIAAGERFPAMSLLCLVYEKLPLISLAVLASVLVFLTERGVGALSSLAAVSLDARIANAVVSYVVYIQRMIWPSGLAFFYPHPVTIPLWKSISTLIALGAVSLLVFRERERHPYLPVGWLWYLGMLLPVIGLIQVGPHAMADRYAYVPMIGISMMITWGFPDMANSLRIHRNVVSIAAVLTLMFFTAMTWFQLGTWRDSYALFGHAIKVTKKNYIAHNNLGLVYYHDGRFDEAIRSYRAALESNPNYAFIYNNLGAALVQQGKYAEAVPYLKEALNRYLPDVGIHHNLGTALAQLGFHEKAVFHYREAIRMGSGKADIYDSLGVSLMKLDRLEEADDAFRKALQMEPQHKGAAGHSVEMNKIREGR
jgi:Flp pilus assembly protein TadD